MIFIPNDVLLYPGEPERMLRILWLHPNGRSAFVIDAQEKRAWPVMQDVNILEQEVSSGSARLADSDLLLVTVDASQLPLSHREVRDKAWQMIEPLVADVPAIFLADKRARRVRSVCEVHGVTAQTIYRYLRRYWQRGQIPNALLPDYQNSGGKGQERIPTGKKRGRPRKYGIDQGVNVDADMRRVFRVAVKRYYAKNRKFTLRGAYEEMKSEFFYKKVIDHESGKVKHLPMHPDGIPTLAQFTYWLSQDNDLLALERTRRTARVYDKDMRGLLGTSTAEVMGPGSRYQIDATLADVYLVSRYDRSLIVGRPVLYIVVDVFSRMIVGIYAGFEGPSWVGAMMALANTASDKVAFCQQYGLEIGEADWPCHFLPSGLLGDRGEIEAHYINTLINNFKVRVENTAPYRADWKGIVEQHFRLLPMKFKAYVPGYIETDFRERGGRDYRLDATLDIDQFTRIVIECVLYYNNERRIGRYDMDRDVAAAGVAPIPIDLWEWGIANRSGALRAYPEDFVRFSLLPSDTATVTTNGIRYKGCFYSCSKAVEERWFDRARQSISWHVNISYDPRCMDEIYLHDSDSKKRYQSCQLTERSRADRGMSLWEIDQLQIGRRHDQANHQPHEQLAKADLSSRIKKVVEEGAALLPTTNRTDAERTRGIRQNRAVEKARIRESECFQPDERTVPQAGSSKIIPLRPAPDDDLAAPDITEILGSLGDDQDG